MTREEAISLLKHITFKDDTNCMNEARNMAIEALEKDCSKCSRRKFYQQGHQDGLNDSKWIPCSERLPECDWGFENTEGLLFQLESGTIEAGFYGTGGKYRDRYFRPYRSDSEGFDVKNVIAWQPLPEPYKEGEI